MCGRAGACACGVRVGLLLLPLFAGCVDPKVISLVFDEGAAVTFEVGTSHNLSVTMEATEGTPRTVAWQATCGEVMGMERRGTYVAPDAAGECVVTATSTFDPTKVARLVVTVVQGVEPGGVVWTRQFGSDNHDWIRRIALGADGRVFVSGETQGDLDGAPLGANDLFLRAYDADGTLRWARHFGTFMQEFTNGLATDASGNVYVAGTAGATLAGSSAGGSDAFVRKYDADGNELWTRQFGTDADDTAQGIAIDSVGRVWVAGWTQGALEGQNAGGPDAYVRLFDTSGETVWTRQFGSDAFDYGLAIAVDGRDGAVVAVNTTGAITGTSQGGIDWSLKRFDADGKAGFTKQFGTGEDDRVYGLAPRAAGGVVAAGANGNEAFVQSVGADGETAWTRTIGSVGEELGQDVATNAAGEIVVVGMTTSDLAGPNVGFFDAFARKFDAAGNTVWTRQFGTAADDYAWGAALTSTGEAVVGGRTDGVFASPWFGGSDAFLRRFAP